MPLSVWFFEREGLGGVEVSLGGTREEMERTLVELSDEYQSSKILDHIVIDGMLGEVLSALCSATKPDEPYLDYALSKLLRRVYDLGRDSVFKE